MLLNPNYLYLLLLLIPYLIFVLYSFRKRKVKNYSSIVFFKKQKHKQHRFLYRIRNILKIIVFILIIIFTVFFISNPFIKSDRYEYLLIYIDNNKYMNIDNTIIDSIIEHYGGEEQYRRVLIADNNTIKDYNKYKYNTTYTFEKIELLKRLQSIINKYSKMSYRSVLLTNREFEKQYFTDIIYIEPLLKNIFIVSINSVLTLYSQVDSNANIEMYNDDMPVFKDKIELKKGFNYINIPNVLFNKIICNNDTLVFEQSIRIINRIVNNRTNNKYIEKALKVLSIENDNSGIVFDFNDNINKGIVFTQYGDKFVDKSELFYSKDIPSAIKYGFTDLQFKKISNNIGVEKLIYDKRGNIILSKRDDIYFLNVPIDTIYSNIVYMPGFIALIDYIVNRFYTDTKYINAELKLRRELLNTNKYEYKNNNSEKLRSIKKELFIIILFLLIIYLLI